MENRKIICLITSNPEAVYQQRIISGVFSQCEKYGYDVVVFTPLVAVHHYYPEYLHAELNIFNLINFDLIDGVIVDPISLSSNNVKWVLELVGKTLKKYCKKPVISIDLPLEDFPVVYTDDVHAFTVITNHLLDVHKCKNIYLLTGMENYPISYKRLDGYANALKAHGMELDMKRVFFGDFWYTSGEALAERIASGEVEIPDAVICANDYMAIGLVNRLTEHGIKVPEQVLVTGYDATHEAALNDTTITTYVPDIRCCTHEAVNAIHAIIEPDVPVIPAERAEENFLRLCRSCGCPENMAYIKKRLNDSLYVTNHNYGEKGIYERVDISMLLESYMLETLTATKTPDECLYRIYELSYLLRPYESFFLCMREDWLDTDKKMTDGYPDTMKNVIRTVSHPTDEDYGVRSYCNDNTDRIFKTSLMLPQIFEERDKPYAFYFTPVHFEKDTLGYAVLQCEIDQQHKINNVYRNWVRNINNALEMSRVQHKLTMFSQRDAMTGLYNRRGMDNCLKSLMNSTNENDSLLVYVIDMDGLKSINDTYGHIEGDYGLRIIARTAQSITKGHEICVRAGGDEFYIIGVGEYSQIEINRRLLTFKTSLLDSNKSSDKPYEISASIGWCCRKLCDIKDFSDVLDYADEDMYRNKQKRKKQRR